MVPERSGKEPAVARWPGSDSPDGVPVGELERRHEQSSLARAGTFRGPDAIDWGSPPPPFKPYPGHERISLPPAAAPAPCSLGAVLRGPGPRSRATVALADLGALLHHGIGITARRAGLELRAAPSAGGLAPVELYLGVRPGHGLEPGLFHYAPDRHGLDVLGRGALDPARLGVGTLDDDVLALVVASAVFRRTGHKYGDRAYRYVLADAGHALENVRIAAATLGLGALPLPRCDLSRMAAALALSDRDEGVAAVVALRASPGAASPLGARLAPRAAPEALVALPPAALAEQDALGTIVARRSVRRFRDTAIALPVLAGLLADSAQGPHWSAAIDSVVVVNRVAGLAPGVYRFRPGEHGLERLGRGDHAARAGVAALDQPVVGRAAVVVLLAAERSAVLAEGARGYRHAHLEAGVVSERLLLGAVARGLGACPVGAFYDAEAAALLGVEAERQWVLLMVAIGCLAR